MLGRSRLFALWMMLMLSACISQTEHEEAVQRAIDEQKALFDGEMQKMQADAEKASKEKESQIDTLATEVKRLGGDLSTLSAALGERDVKLASTQASLQATEAELLALRKQREAAEQEAAVFKALAEKLKSMVDSGKLEIVTRKGRMTVKLPDEILFPSGSKNLKKDGREALISVAAALKEVAERDFVIAGHTDNVPVKKGGAFKSNWELSTARAVEVVKLMIDSGVDPFRVAAAGYGEFDPVGDNSNPEGRQKNRRLEIILMPKIEALPTM